MITTPIVSSAPIYLEDPGISTDSKPCYAARIARQSSNIGSGQSNYAYQSYAARIARQSSNISSGQSNYAYQSYAARIARQSSNISSGQSNYAYQSYAARIARQSSDIGSGQSNYAYQSYAARITMSGPGIDNCTQPSGRPDLSIYIETSTNPLPSGNGFVAAPPIAKSQHGHVTPLLKEKLHHG
jgi:hypothetical protein